MYKATYRFLQRLVEQGRKLTGPPRPKQHAKPRARRARALNKIAEEAKLRNWVAYIRHCRESNVKPAVPAVLRMGLVLVGLAVCGGLWG